VGAGEFNGDGKPDLAIVSVGLGATVTLLFGQGDGSFINGASIPVPHQPRTVTVADFNADGKQDIASVAFGSVHTLLGNGAGGFASVGTFVVSTESPTAEVGDFNGDGKPDLAAERGGSNLDPLRLAAGPALGFQHGLPVRHPGRCGRARRGAQHGAAIDHPVAPS
jgi:hypothetical protein